MTIKKAFKALGVDLTEKNFTHGMLYVVLSRVVSPDSLTPLVREDHKTNNFVYSEIFN